MQLSIKGAGFIRTHEGYVGRYYLDPVGIPTIGVGFTWRSRSFKEWWRKYKGTPFEPGATITRLEADRALRYLVEKEYGKAVNAFLGKQVSQHVFDGMVSPVFNLGPGSLKWKWAAAAKRGDYRTAAERLRSTGTTAKGKKLKGLVLRRIEEAELIEHGDYTVGKMPTTVKDPILKRGQRGIEVKELQISLTELGHYDGIIDGIFGVGTEAAVMSFQRRHLIKDDGWAGTQTLKALKAAQLITSAPKPQTRPDAPQQAETALTADLSKPMVKSKTIWGGVLTFVGGAAERLLSAIGNLDWRVSLALLALSAIGLIIVFRNRHAYAKEARALIKEFSE